ncbi:MAG: RcnB family protein [Pseudomonadota bacterium]
MKKFLIAAIATTLVASPIVAAAPADAQSRQSERTVKYKPNGKVVVKQRTVTRQNYRQPVRQSYRSNWRKGERFNRAQARNYRQVTNWRQYQNRRLYAPQRGQQWVQSGNDAILITVASGVVAAVLAGAFN